MSCAPSARHSLGNTRPTMPSPGHHGEPGDDHRKKDLGRPNKKRQTDHEPTYGRIQTVARKRFQQPTNYYGGQPSFAGFTRLTHTRQFRCRNRTPPLTTLAPPQATADDGPRPRAAAPRPAPTRPRPGAHPASRHRPRRRRDHPPHGLPPRAQPRSPIRNPWRNRCYSSNNAMDLFDLGTYIVKFRARTLAIGRGRLLSDVDAYFGRGTLARRAVTAPGTHLVGEAPRGRAQFDFGV